MIVNFHGLRSQSFHKMPCIFSFIAFLFGTWISSVLSVQDIPPDLSCHPGFNSSFAFFIREQQKHRNWTDVHTNYCKVTHRLQCRFHCMARVIGVIDRKMLSMGNFEYFFNSVDYMENYWKELFPETDETKGLNYPRSLAKTVVDICKEALDEVKKLPCQFMNPLMDCLSDHLFCDFNDYNAVDVSSLRKRRRRRSKKLFR